MNKVIFIFLCFLATCTIAVSCMKTEAVSPKENSIPASASGKESTAAGSGAYMEYQFSPAVFTFKDCSTKLIKGSCSITKYNGGLKAYASEEYENQSGIWVSLCNDSIFSTTKTLKIEVHTSSVCGPIASTGTILPNRTQGQALTDIALYNATLKYYPVVILPNGKKFYANPITVKSIFHPGT